jgi:hypothetical protein
MKFSRCAMAVLAALLTCGAAKPPHSVHMNSRHPWLYVSGRYDNVAFIYDLGQFGAPEIGRINKGISDAIGMVVDGHGTLYIANANRPRTGGTGFVSIYPAGAMRPSLTL